jgi:hypothetical protein
MKYICDHERTLGALRTWAGPEKLVTANYFFWNAGLPMQKSQKGLLQSLLYQVLRSCPDLIQKICTGHQVELYRTFGCFRTNCAPDVSAGEILLLR